MAIFEVQKFRVAELPAVEQRVLGAEYWVRNQTTGQLEIHVVGTTDATVVTRQITRADVESMIQASELPDLAGHQASNVGTKVTYNAKGLVTGSEVLAQSDIPDLDGTKIISALSVDTSGNAATATALAAPVTIAGKSFDGTQNVEIAAADVGAVALADVGVTVAPLVGGIVPAANLPTFVDDVVEVTAFDDLPGNANNLNVAAEKGKIYLVVETTGAGTPEETTTTKVYRWGGSVYVQIVDGVSMADQAMRLADARSITATGDGSWTVLFDGSQNVTGEFTLADTGVTAGDYGFINVDAKGRVLSVRRLEISDLPTGITAANVASAASIAVVDPAW